MVDWSHCLWPSRWPPVGRLEVGPQRCRDIMVGAKKYFKINCIFFFFFKWIYLCWYLNPLLLCRKSLLFDAQVRLDEERAQRLEGAELSDLPEGPGIYHSFAVWKYKLFNCIYQGHLWKWCLPLERLGLQWLRQVLLSLTTLLTIYNLYVQVHLWAPSPQQERIIDIMDCLNAFLIEKKNLETFVLCLYVLSMLLVGMAKT